MTHYGADWSAHTGVEPTEGRDSGNAVCNKESIFTRDADQAVFRH